MEPKEPALSSKSGSEKKSGSWRPTKRQVLWAIGMAVALLTTALLIVNLHPEIWKSLLEERILTLIAIGVSVTAIIVLLAIGGAASSWTGFRGKTVWDLLQLLIVPLVLVGIGLLFEMQQADRQQATEEQQQALAEQRAQDEAVQAYLSQMSQLMLGDSNLLEAEQGDTVYTLAQARTSTLILRLDSEHNESVTRFLINSGLAEGSRRRLGIKASARLLREITLSHATLSDAYLPNADLRYADLSGANLSDADLNGADLSGANLNGADLSNADLNASKKVTRTGGGGGYVDVVAANLNGAKLNRADLSGADLRNAILSHARLHDADLRKADLRDAYLPNADEKIAAASSLEGATMPNGQKYEDWLKSKDREEDGKNGGSS